MSDPDYKTMVEELIGVVEALAEQQAMPDDFYAEPLERAKRMVANLPPIWKATDNPWIGTISNDRRKVCRGGRHFDFWERQPKHFGDWKCVGYGVDVTDDACQNFLLTGKIP